MCRATVCKTCGKITWAGCGMHAAQVQARVPAEQWCGGHDDPRGTAPKSSWWPFGKQAR